MKKIFEYNIVGVFLIASSAFVGTLAEAKRGAGGVLLEAEVAGMGSGNSGNNSNNPQGQGNGGGGSNGGGGPGNNGVDPSDPTGLLDNEIDDDLLLPQTTMQQGIGNRGNGI